MEKRSRRRIERFRSMDNIFPVGALGATIDAAKHLVEHYERRIREDRFHLTGEHHQSRQSAWRIEPRKMLGAENSRFLGDRPITGAMNPLLAIWIDAQAADELQALDDANQVLLRRRLWPITQPSKPRAVSVVAARDHCLELSNRSLFQSLDEILVGLLSSAGASRQADALQNCRRRQQNAASAKRFDHGGNDDSATIRGNCLVRRNLCDVAIIVTAERTDAQMRLYLAEMLTTGFVTLCVFTISTGLDSELMGQKGDHFGCGRFLTTENSAGELQIRKVHGKPQSIGVTSSLADQ